jgi:hypothetical protein
LRAQPGDVAYPLFVAI